MLFPPNSNGCLAPARNWPYPVTRSRYILLRDFSSRLKYRGLVFLILRCYIETVGNVFAHAHFSARGLQLRQYFVRFASQFLQAVQMQIFHHLLHVEGIDAPTRGRDAAFVHCDALLDLVQK